MSNSEAILAALHDLAQAFNAHDLDRIMEYFAADCVLEMPRGPEPCGRRYVGKPAVRDALAGRFAGLPDVHYGDDTHFVAGDVGVSRWTVTGTTPQGQRIQANGCDFYSFCGGQVIKKDSYWKIVEK